MVCLAHHNIIANLVRLEAPLLLGKMTLWHPREFSIIKGICYGSDPVVISLQLTNFQSLIGLRMNHILFREDPKFPIRLRILAIDDPKISQKLAFLAEGLKVKNTHLALQKCITCQVATIGSILKFESK